MAAGASTRMGSPKPLLPLDGSTYLETVVSTLRAVPLDPVLVVLGCEAVRIRAATSAHEVTWLENRDWKDGMLSSLQTAVRFLQSLPDVSGLMMALVDSPCFGVETARQLLRAHEKSREMIQLPVYRGQRGHPTVFGRSVWKELLTAPRDAGARAVIVADPGRVQEVIVDDAWVIRDADTPRQHRRMQGNGSDVTG